MEMFIYKYIVVMAVLLLAAALAWAARDKLKIWANARLAGSRSLSLLESGRISYGLSYNIVRVDTERLLIVETKSAVHVVTLKNT